MSTIKVSELLEYVRHTPAVAHVLQLDKLRMSSRPAGCIESVEKSSLPMNEETGRAVGCLSKFMGIPPEVLRPFAAKVATSWRLGGYSKKSCSKIYRAF